MKNEALYTLRNETLPVHLGVHWTGDNFEEVRARLTGLGPAVRWNGNVDQKGDILVVHQENPGEGLKDRYIKVHNGGWIIWERGRTYVTLVDDDEVQSMFPIIEPGDTEEERESIAEDHRCNEQFMDKLKNLMNTYPNLPIEWIEPSEGGAYEWIGGYQFGGIPSEPEIKTIARGWRNHVIIQGETGETRMDSPDDPDLEWYDAIVVRV